MTPPAGGQGGAQGLRPQSYWLDLLRRHGVRPDKRLGQHFLFQPEALQRVVEAATLDTGETALEIGAGVGALTHLLASRAANVVAVEFDRRLIPALREAVEGDANVTIREGDFLALELSQIVGEGAYAVVANIPYNITSAVIRKLLESPRPPARAVLTVQEEVAERIIAGPGSMSLLSLSVQLFGEASIRARIPAKAFHPPPKVDSAVVRIDLAAPRFAPEVLAAVFRLAHAGFGQRRKQLHNALAAGFGGDRDRVHGWLSRAGVAPERRAQELEIAAWGRLAEAMLEAAPAEPPGEA